MPGDTRCPGPVGLAQTQTHLQGISTGGFSLFGRRPGPHGMNGSGTGQVSLRMRKDHDWVSTNFQNFLVAHGMGQLWEVVRKHGRAVIGLPFELPNLGNPVQDAVHKRLSEVPLFPWRRDAEAACEGQPDPDRAQPHLMFELPSMSKLLHDDREAAKVLASTLGVDPYALHGWAFHVVYRNDGKAPVPVNLGSGSDQGATAYLGLFLTRHDEGTGLRRLGINLIDMRTPRGFLADGASATNESYYRSVLAPYQGLTALDFEVRVSQSRAVSVDLYAKVGVDSVRWGKFVQDFIHGHVSDSPYFPWPKEPDKFYAQTGAVLKVSPKWLQSQSEFAGLKYRGQIEFQGRFEAGTHATELTVGARYKIRTAWFKIGRHEVHLDMDVLSVDARAFIRNNQGQDKYFKGAELGIGTKIMVRMGRVGIGVGGDVLFSQDKSFQTGNEVGTHPALNPFPQVIGGEPTGGGAGHHGTGMLLFEYRFGK